jgi:hypothetical protein
MPSSASVAMQFNGIEPDAERLLAGVWRVLEEHGLPTPRLDIRSAKPLIEITLTFESIEDRALIEKNIKLDLALGRSIR